MTRFPAPPRTGADGSPAAAPLETGPDTAPRPLRILLLEDVETDAELVRAELRRAKLDFEWRRVETPHDFLTALTDFEPAIVLADFSLPQFSALDALALLRTREIRVPFILVTGTHTEEVAVQCIHEGADDYVLKERLARLPSAVQRALRNWQTEAAKEKAVSALRRSEERYRLIADNTHDLICLLDPQGALRYVSPSAEHLLGWAAAELASRTDLWKTARDAPAVGVAVLRDACREPGRAADLFALDARGEWRSFEAIGNWVLDDHGVPQYCVVVLRDVTDLRAAHLQLIQAEKMELVGRLAAGVAHEVKNPLTVLLMGVEYLQQRFQWSEPELVTLMEDMEACALRANSVIGELLDFSAPGKLDRVEVQLPAVINRALDLVKHEVLRARVTVAAELPANLPSVLADRTKLEQVFVNLFLNAIHAMPEGGTLTVRARRTAGAGSGHAMLVTEVEDTGLGIDAGLIAKVFEPFFTTKGHGGGTGLGLTVVRKIVELHAGSITLQPRPGGGTIARVALPLEEAG